MDEFSRRGSYKTIKKNSEDDIYSNIIALCPNHHTELDAGNFYIEQNSKFIIHFDEGNEFNQKKIKGSIKYIKPEYILYRTYLFLKKTNKYIKLLIYKVVN